jgi:SWI/SNF-related matrix-associated actin-dependent regulator of chromatin subfamily A-like protein 1
MLHDVEISFEFLSKLLNWSQPRVMTGGGKGYHMLTAEPTDDFEFLWKNRGAELKAMRVDRGRPGLDGIRPVIWWQAAPKAVNDELERRIQASASMHSDIHVPAPDGCVFRGYQKVAVEFARGKRGVLLADEMGTGKTICMAGIVNDHPEWKRGIIVCGNNAKINWMRELKTWLYDRTLRTWVAESNLFPDVNIVILHYESLKKFERYLARTWDFAIIDEAHRICNQKTQFFKMCSVIRDNSRHRYALTGTPVVNNAEEVFSILNFLDPVRYINPIRFKYAYAGQLESLQRELRSTIMVRRLKSEVCSELPPKIRELVELDVSHPSLRAELDAFAQTHAPKLSAADKEIREAELAHDQTRYLAAMSRLEDVIKVAFSEMSTYRKLCGLVKLPLIIEEVQQALLNANKVICFGHHREVLEKIHAEFKDQSVLIYGDTRETPQTLIDRFQMDPAVKLAIVSLTAGAESTNMTAAEIVIMGEWDWRPAKMAQAEDRTHRSGLDHSVLYRYVALKNSIDGRMAKYLLRKLEIAHSTLDSIVQK